MLTTNNVSSTHIALERSYPMNERRMNTKDVLFGELIPGKRKLCWELELEVFSICYRTEKENLNIHLNVIVFALVLTISKLEQLYKDLC